MLMLFVGLLANTPGSSASSLHSRWMGKLGLAMNEIGARFRSFITSRSLQSPQMNKLGLVMREVGDKLKSIITSHGLQSRWMGKLGLALNEIGAKFRDFVTSLGIKFRPLTTHRYRWPLLAVLLVALLVTGVVLGFIISVVTNTLVAQAVRNGNSGMVQTLLYYGANPNGVVSNDVTYLDHASQMGDVRVASILLDHGVDPNTTAIGKPSPLTHAIEKNQLDVAQLLLKRGAKIPAAKSGLPALLYSVATRRDIAMVDLLLDNGLDINAPLPDGRPLIDWAVRNSAVELVKVLIQNGADPNLVVQEGQTLLNLAVALDLPHVVGTLVDQGADINAPVRTPVSNEFASLFNTEYARFFLTKDGGLTPLMLAILRKRQDTVRVLLARNARTNTPTKTHKIYPIGLAANRGNIEMMQVLLGRDPDPAKQERHVFVSLSKQTATVYVKGNASIKTRVSTGRKGFATPPGKYVITNKYRNWTSTIYRVPMRYFMRLNASAIGLHEGIVPRRPASHGCIRVPSGTAAQLFASLEVGDVVTISEE